MNLLRESCFSQKKYMRVPTAFAGRLYYYVPWAGSFSCREDFLIRREGMSSLLLLYTRCGSGVLDFRGETYTLASRTLAFLPCGVPHRYRTETAPWDFDFLHVSGNLIRAYGDHILALYGTPALTVSPDIGRRIANLVADTAAGAPEATVSDRIYRLLITLICDRAAENGGFDGEKIMKYMAENYATVPDAGAIADAFGYSRSYFSTRFREACGRTPYDYLCELRLTAAKEWLGSTSLPVAEIAERCGFASPSAFIRAFGKFAGQTPLAYRKRYKITDFRQ